MKNASNATAIERTLIHSQSIIGGVGVADLRLIMVCRKDQESPVGSGPVQSSTFRLLLRRSNLKVEL
jgi:hypothetical protein